MKKIILILLSCILLASCQSTQPMPEVQMLPVYDPAIPDRPVLEEIPADAVIPVEVNLNLIKLFTYIETLEATLDSWSIYYNDLRSSGKVGIVVL